MYFEIKRGGQEASMVLMEVRGLGAPKENAFSSPNVRRHSVGRVDHLLIGPSYALTIIQWEKKVVWLFTLQVT